MFQIWSWYLKKLASSKILFKCSTKHFHKMKFTSHSFPMRTFVTANITSVTIFPWPFNLFESCPWVLCVCSHAKCQNPYQVSYHSDEVENHIFQSKMTEQHKRVKKCSLKWFFYGNCYENAYLERTFLRVYSLKLQGFIKEVCGSHFDRCIFFTFIRYVLHWVFCSKWARSVCFLKIRNHFKVRKHTTVCICHVWACMVTWGGQRQITSLYGSKSGR